MDKQKYNSQFLHLFAWPSLGIVLIFCMLFFASTTQVMATSNNENVDNENEATSGDTTLLPIMFLGVPPNIPQTRFGVQMYFDTGDNGDNPYFDSVVDSGANWIRCNIPWKDIEPTDTTPENYNWGLVQRAVGANRDARYNQIITLEHAPAWFSGGSDGPPLPGQSLDDLAEFMAAVAERYDGDGYKDGWKHPVINHFELYNEPDSIGRWGNVPEQYAEMLSVVYPAIKAANPNAQILFGGVAMDWFVDIDPQIADDAGVGVPGFFVRSFVNDVLAAGGGSYFDIMNIHQYPQYGPEWTTDKGVGLKEKVEAVRQTMATYGLDKPVMITESGTNSNPTAVRPASEEIQARYLVALYTQVYAADVSTMIWFSMYDDDSVEYSFENGLVQQPLLAGGEPYRKQAFTAYQTIESILEPMSYTRQLTSAEIGHPDMEAHQFTNGTTGQPFYVAWINPIQTTEQAVLTVPGSQATLTDIYGTVINNIADGADGAADGQIAIPVGGQPVYIQIN